MSSIVSIANIARQAQSAARRGQPRSTNPYPPMDPAHAVWADCHAAAAACADFTGCDRVQAQCKAGDATAAPQAQEARHA